MIMSALTKVEMSSCLVDCRLSQGGTDDRRGPGHDGREGTPAGACDPPGDGQEAHAGGSGYAGGADGAADSAAHPAGVAGGGPGTGASGAGPAVEPADRGAGQ